MGRAYGYCRLSKYDVDLTCESCHEGFFMKNPFEREAVCPHCNHVMPAGDRPQQITRQAEEIAQKFQSEFEGRYAWGDLYWEVVSGNVPFAERPQGSRVNLRLEQGDLLIVSKVDRGWRDFVDFVNFSQSMKRRGVKIFICEFNLDISTEWGEMFVTLMAVFAKAERDRISKRIREQKAWAREKGLSTNCHAGYGFKFKCSECGKSLPVKGRTCPGCGIPKTASTKIKVADEAQRALMKRIYLAKLEHSWEEMLDWARTNRIRWKGSKISRATMRRVVKEYRELMKTEDVA